MHYIDKKVFYVATLVAYAAFLPGGMGMEAPAVLRTDEELKEDGLLRDRERKGFVCVIEIPDTFLPVNAENATFSPRTFGEMTSYVTDEELEKEGIKADVKGGIKKKVMDRAQGRIKEGMSVKECRRESWNEVELVCDREQPPSDSCWDGSKILHSSPKNKPWDTRSCHEVALEIGVRRYGSPEDPELICDKTMTLQKSTTCSNDDDCDDCKKCKSNKCGYDWSYRDYICPYTNQCILGDKIYFISFNWFISGYVHYTDTHGNPAGDDTKLHLHAWWMRDNYRLWGNQEEGDFVQTGIKELDLYQRSRIAEGYHYWLYEGGDMEVCETQKDNHKPKVHFKGWFEGDFQADGTGKKGEKNTCIVDFSDNHITVSDSPPCLLDINMYGDQTRDVFFSENVNVDGDAWGGNGLCKIQELEHVDWLPSRPLGCCMSDCDYDDHCADGLQCYHRDDNDPPPSGSCGGGGETVDWADICIAELYF